MTHEASGRMNVRRDSSTDNTAHAPKTDTQTPDTAGAARAHPDGGPATICWICQTPISGDATQYHDEPVHRECHPDTPGTGRLVTDGGTTCDYDAVGFVVASTYRIDSLRVLATDPATPSGIAATTGHDIAHISRGLGDLRDRALVELLVSEDTRKGRIYDITDDGETVLAEANTIMRRDDGGGA